MKLATKYHGEVEIHDNEIITFEKGIPGFEEEKNFVIIPYDNKSPFYILQSTKNEELAFITVDIFTFYSDYYYDLSKNDIELLQVSDPADVITLGIVTVKEELNNSTVNLYAPLVINLNKKLGKQIILLESGFNVRTPLFVKST
ncbi:MAG: Flagellar assembly factor fliW [Bacillales bacterium]|jgi:flagellar assembly factor FliW|nr:Flagellar assembly factor fliW [Bacillales bacterium]